MIILFMILNLMVLSTVTYLLWKRSYGLIRKWMWPAWIMKCAAGICLGIIYEYYYGLGDTLVYFNGSLALTDLARSDPGAYINFLWSGDQLEGINNGEARALVMVKVTSLLALLAKDNYWIISLYYSTVSFIAAWRLTVVINKIVPAVTSYAIMGLWFLPSAVFWASGLIKESIAMSCLFFLFSIFLKLWSKSKIFFWETGVLLLSLWLLWILKYYYLAVFLPFTVTALVIAFIVRRYDRPVSMIGKLIVWTVIFLIPAITITLLHPNFYPDVFLEVIVSSHDQFVAISDPSGLIHYRNLEPGFRSIVNNIPLAFFSGLFRPFIWEACTPLQAVAGVENLFLLILSIGALWNFKELLRSPYRLFLGTVLLYCFVLCVFLALSTPNFGTLSRYRVSFLPFYFVVICIENPVLKRLSPFKQRKSSDLAP